MIDKFNQSYVNLCESKDMDKFKYLFYVHMKYFRQLFYGGILTIDDFARTFKLLSSYHHEGLFIKFCDYWFEYKSLHYAALHLIQLFEIPLAFKMPDDSWIIQHRTCIDVPGHLFRPTEMKYRKIIKRKYMTDTITGYKYTTFTLALTDKGI